MTAIQIARILRQWWPAALALALLILASPGLQYAPGVDAIGCVIATVALAFVLRLPLAAVSISMAGTVMTFASTLAGGLATLCALTASLTSFVITMMIMRGPLRHRLYLSLGLIAAGGAAGFVQWVAQLTAWGPWGATPVPIVLGLAVTTVVAAVSFGIRAFLDALQAERQKQIVEVRSTVVESELRDERLRTDLTHEFHDVMAHSLSVLAAQAEGLRLSYHQHPERIEPVLTTISDTARLALVEVRSMLERVEDDSRRPQPTAIDIPALIDQSRSTGAEVLFFEAGTHGNLSKVAHIAAYRIVQEALTNALRHGASSGPVKVQLAWAGPGLSIGVASPRDEGRDLAPIGRGIAGMHERAKQAGGWVDIVTSDAEFVVSVYLPYSQSQPNTTLPLGEDQLPTTPHPRVTTERSPNPAPKSAS